MEAHLFRVFRRLQQTSAQSNAASKAALLDAICLLCVSIHLHSDAAPFQSLFLLFTTTFSHPCWVHFQICFFTACFKLLLRHYLHCSLSTHHTCSTLIFFFSSSTFLCWHHTPEIDSQSRTRPAPPLHFSPFTLRKASTVSTFI